jgi:hypothetical protein
MLRGNLGRLLSRYALVRLAFFYIFRIVSSLGRTGQVFPSMDFTCIGVTSDRKRGDQERASCSRREDPEALVREDPS